MKILRVISSMNPANGGPCQGIRNSIPSLQELGCQNEVVCLDEPGQDFLKGNSFSVHALGKGAGAWAANAALNPWLEHHLPRFNVVIIHGLWQQSSYAVTKMMRNLRRKRPGETLPRVFVMPHGMLDPWFQRDPSRRLKAWRNTIYWHLIERHTIAQADGVLFTCQRELELARETFAAYRPRTEHNVGYGVTPPPMATEGMQQAFYAACPQAKGRPYLLFLSRIHPKKGVDLLIEAYASLAQDWSGPIPMLVLAGPTESAYAGSMKNLAANRGLLVETTDSTKGAGIAFTGMLQKDAKWGAFYGCEAFILPSHQENFGIAVVEAMACGKPVLISNQVNIWQDLERGQCAIIDENKLEGTKRLIGAWLNLSKARQAELSRKASDCYRSQYLPDAAATKLLNAIRSK